MQARIPAVLALAALLAAPAMAEPVKLRFGHPAGPKTHVVSQMVIPWSERLSKASDGTMEITVFPAGQLGGNEVSLDAIKSGVQDIGWINTQYYPGKYNKSEVGLLPFEVKKSEAASLAMWRLFKNGLIADEYTDLKLLAIWAYPASTVHTTFPARKLEDFKGKKIATIGTFASELAKHLGATPVAIEFTENYPAIQRGTVNGTLLQWTAVQPLRLWEVAKYHTDAGVYGAVTMIAMNKGTYDKLPPKAKELIDANSGEKWSREWGQFWDRVDQEGRQEVRNQKDNTIFELDAKELERWRTAIQPVTNDWIKKTPKGAELLKTFRAERDRAAAGK
jgi:TRAP-type C4-dicarboxylate transport system substrate-binding protein